VLLGGCGSEAEKAASAPSPTVSAYVGSEACAACHADVTRTWQTTRHHEAMLPADRNAPLRAAPSADGPLVARHDQLVITGASLDHATDVEVRYALGRKHVEQYVGALAPGRLQALPRAYDVVRGEWFDLFAGETRTPDNWGHWTNRGMNASAQCLVCHTTDYDKGYDSKADTYASRWREMGVGCEACHGPGRAHVDARRAGRDDPWAHPDPERLLDACGACHARRVERAAFTPGDAFADAFESELLDTDAYHPDGQVKEELYELVSFQQSKMFHEGVRCWNCHDPHADGTRAEGTALCRTCHEAKYESDAHTHHAAGSAGADCRGCHMPVTVYMQRDPRHDHAFLRPDPEATIAVGVPNACNRCHADRDAAWAATQMRAWYPDDRTRALRRAATTTIASARAGDAAAVPGLLELMTTARDAVHRASAARLLARFPTASGVTTGLVQALGDDDPIVRAAAAWTFGQRPSLAPDARAALLGRTTDPVRTVRQHVAFALRDVAVADLAPDAAGALTHAVDEWTAGQRRLGDTPEAHYNLAILAGARGDPERAVAEYREALRLWPSSFQARHNLGMLLAQLGRLDEAGAEFEAVLATDSVPDTAFALGLLRAQQGRWPAAIAALERCVGEDPAFPRARYNLALAYAKGGETVKALDELERAAADDDTHRDAVLTLIDLARAAGDKPRLERWVLEAARLDPEVRENPELRGFFER
jgi:tetratricopeptide (TPR) repeat protein